MKNKDFSPKTINGYDLFEVSSAFQKSIRRGLEKESLFWAVELYDSGYSKYAWKRMQIITNEDVGLAEPSAPAIMAALEYQFQRLSDPKDRKKSNRLPYVQAVLYLVRCRKSRLVDWTLNVIWDEHYNDSFALKIPDFALDKHTRRGKELGKTSNDFIDEGSLLNNHTSLKHEEERKELCRNRWNAPDFAGKFPKKEKKFPYRLEGGEDEKPSQGSLWKT